MQRDDEDYAGDMLDMATKALAIAEGKLGELVKRLERFIPPVEPDRDSRSTDLP